MGAIRQSIPAAYTLYTLLPWCGACALWALMERRSAVREIALGAVVVAAGTVLVVAASTIAPFLGSLGFAACVAPLPGYQDVPWYSNLRAIVAVLGPPLAIFLVGEFFALASRNRLLRLLASAFVFVATGLAFVSTTNYYPLCGTYPT